MDRITQRLARIRERDPALAEVLEHILSRLPEPGMLKRLLGKGSQEEKNK